MTNRVLIRTSAGMVVRAVPLILAVGALTLTGSADVQAEGKGKGKGHGSSHQVSAIVVHPAGLQTLDPDLMIALKEKDDGSGIVDGVEVKLMEPLADPPTTGTHWVHLPLTLPSGSHSGKGRSHDFFVYGVEVCHQEDAAGTEPLGSFIDVIRLTQLESPAGAEIKHEDETDRKSETPASECVQSLVPFPFEVEGALTLSLNLNFMSTDDVFRFGAIRILVSPRDDVRPSEPSAPSEPSEPSAPSGPSGSED